jgi:hypothetical protein
MVRAKSSVALAATLWLCCTGPAWSITLHDRLVCAFADGSTVHLKQAYDYSLIPLPILHGSRRTDRGGWVVDYFSRKGESAKLTLSSWFSAESHLVDMLDLACAKSGLKNGVALAPWSFSVNDQLWVRSSEAHSAIDSLRPIDPETRAAMVAKGVDGSTFQFAMIMPIQNQWVWEQPLYSSAKDYFLVPFTAVYQSFSEDQGKTWSKPVVTTDALIFEMGKPWRDQCFLGWPVRLNGKAVKTDRPHRCAAPTASKTK